MIGSNMQEQLVLYIKDKISVTDNEMETILSYFKPIALKKNELLLTNGQFSQKTFFFWLKAASEYSSSIKTDKNLPVILLLKISLQRHW